jgi:Flp pilus assembly protein TadG
MRRASTGVPQTTCPRRGAAAVEFALILPLLVTLVLACVDFGQFAYNYIAVTNAARAGASYGIMNNYTNSTKATWTAGIQAAAWDEIQQQFTSGNVSNWSVPTPNVIVEANGLRRVQVTASYTFRPYFPWNWTRLTLPSNVTVSRQVEMRSIR